jgi:uncharacterized membrane protein YkvA (DUF1232 family)
MPSDPVVIELNAREQRLWDRVRAHLLPFEPGTGSGMRDVLLLLPDLTVLLFRLLRDPRVPPGAKLIAGLGVAYVLAPIDLLPEILFGPFGLIDDVLVVAAALSRMLNYVHPDLVRAHWSGQGDALEAIHRVTEWSEELVTKRLPAALGRLTGGLLRR